MSATLTEQRFLGKIESRLYFCDDRDPIADGRLWLTFAFYLERRFDFKRTRASTPCPEQLDKIVRN